jgi:pimeloyl-ACP methyl ester carboxylesterase
MRSPPRVRPTADGKCGGRAMRMRVNGINLGYDVRGDGPLTLVLLHAFPLQRHMWDSQAEALAARGIRVVTSDLRGCGESDVGPGPSTMEQHAQDVLGLLDGLGIEQAALGGLSMGGYAVFACLRAWPQRVRGVILADTRATADTEQGRQAREATAQLAEEQGSVAIFDRDKDKLFGAVTLHERPDVIERGRELARANTGQGIAAAARGMALRTDSTDLLPHIGCPALVIVGEQDALTPVTDARAIFERIPDAQLEVITDAGHLSNLERPTMFSNLLARFFDERLARE